MLVCWVCYGTVRIYQYTAAEPHPVGSISVPMCSGQFNCPAMIFWATKMYKR